MPLFERQLEGQGWLCADRLTMADIVAGAGLGFARLIRYEPPPDFPNVRRWGQALMARPGAKPVRR